MKSFTILWIFFLGCILTAFPVRAQTTLHNDANPSPTLTNLPESLQSIQNLIGKGKLKKASKALNKWIKKHPDSASMDQALYLKGQVLFERKLYYQSFEAYEELLKQYPSSELFAPTLRQHVEIARRFLDGAKRKVWGFIPAGASTEAIEILDRVIERWPGSELAAGALMMQADYYYKKKKYIDAQQTYQLLIEDYPASAVYQNALLRSAQATYARFSGPSYDTACLTDARIRFLQYQARFPQHAQELEFDKILSEIDSRLAEKDYMIADFYRRTHRPGAARYYWAYVIQHWPDSSFAQKARGHLAEYNLSSP